VAQFGAVSTSGCPLDDDVFSEKFPCDHAWSVVTYQATINCPDSRNAALLHPGPAVGAGLPKSG